MNLLNWTRLIIMSLLWGGSFFFIEVALEGLTPLTLVLCRVSLAAATLWAVALMWRHPLPRGLRLWTGYALLGLISNALPFTLITWGQQHITSGEASILNAVVPIFTVIIAHFATHDERMATRKVVGIGIGFLGVVALMAPTIQGHVSLENVGQLAVVVAALSYAAGAVYGKQFSGQPAIVNAAAMLGCSAVIMLPATLLIERPWALDPGINSILATLALAELSSALAYLIYFITLRSAGATFVTLVTYLVPVVAMTLGVLILKEPVRPMSLAGVACIFLGLAVIDGRLWNRLTRGRQAKKAPAAAPAITTRRGP